MAIRSMEPDAPRPSPPGHRGQGAEPVTGSGGRWVRFLRQYGPGTRNDNMYDERIERSAHRLGVRALDFVHPVEERLLDAVSEGVDRARSIVLTGTAGDGKSRLCGRLWRSLGGDMRSWASDEVYHETRAVIAGRPRTVGVVRDLTALPSRGPYGDADDKAGLLTAIGRSLSHPDPDHVYVVAANDGQLMEAWRRLGVAPLAQETHALLEALLIGDPAPGRDGVTFFNLSEVPCVRVLDLACDALVAHEGWEAAYSEADDEGFFGPRCPIRRNFETLRDPAFRTRLRQLFELMDLSELHTPIRRVLLLLSNALLGHPDVKDRLMHPADVRALVADGRAHLGDVCQNLFGANLTAARREGLEILEFMTRFGIGEETTNRIDNILLFGPHDEALRTHHEELVERHQSEAALDQLRAARQSYLERPEGERGEDHPFLASLAAQRRSLFFRIPDAQADELHLWDLTVFRHAGRFLRDVVEPLARGDRVSRAVLARLVNGLNRVFTGLLVSGDRELLVSMSLSGSGSGVGQVLQERVSVAPRRDERIEIRAGRHLPELWVQLDAVTRCVLPLNLVRHEFLMRVAAGALAASFSKECQEDILAFKGAILAALKRTRPAPGDKDLAFRLLALNDAGEASDEVIEVPGD